MPVDRASENELTAYENLIDARAVQERASNPLVAAIDRDPDRPRWYVRVQARRSRSRPSGSPSAS